MCVGKSKGTLLIAHYSLWEMMMVFLALLSGCPYEGESSRCTYMRGNFAQHNLIPPPTKTYSL